MKGFRQTLMLALPLALLVGCASAGERGGADASETEGVAVRVDNNLVPPTSLTVWLVSQSGRRAMLGTVTPNEVAVLEARGASTLGQYRLVGETTGGRNRVSRSFYVTERSATIAWDVSSNIVTVR